MKNIVIMGASSGIGLALAEALAKGGLRLGLAARRTEPLHELARRYPDQIEYSSIDVSDSDAPVKLRELITRLGGMDLYFHAAGIGFMNPELNPEVERKMVMTNAVGFSVCLSEAYNYFRSKGGKGQIAALTSVAGTKGIGDMAAYSSSKAFDQTYMTALRQLAHAEGLDLTLTDIRPGWIRTPLLESDKTYPMEMTIEEVLPQILQAVVEKKSVAVIGWKWNLTVGAWRMLPNALWTRMHIKMQKDKDEAAKEESSE
ncbi:MAG: SDR family NAD(P)-dependent oxidoreductase [Bacteroidales bacterium]|nr:SDR family NAD(P)-dependent oxidoreductase [Bacteroidales bacterium]MDE7465696.1 SDR family NAD(P)-dependent oxidoreductase [Muribaculaceae bacterium]